MSRELADRLSRQLSAARSELAVARHHLEIAQDAAHFARSGLEGISDDLAALGLYALADRVHAAFIRLREADPHASATLEMATLETAWG
jgi:hypothetical protein